MITARDVTGNPLLSVLEDGTPAPAVKTGDERHGQDAAYIIDSARARTQFGWRPTIDLDEGLKEVVEWVRTHLDEIRRLPLNYEHRP